MPRFRKNGRIKSLFQAEGAMKKRLLSAILALCMAVALLPVSAMAETSYQARWGTVGQGDVINWTSSGNFAAAVSAANSSSTGIYIQLLSDVTTAGLTFTTSKATTLDLNGFTLSSGDTAAINQNGSGTLTITDSSEDKDGSVTITAPSAGSSVITLGSASGSLVIDGSRISVNNGAAINQASGVVKISDGMVESNLGFAIVSRGTGSVIVSGGTVSGGGDAIMCLAGANVSVSGGVLSANTGYGIYCNSGKIIIPSGSPIIKSGNMAMNKAPDLSSYLDAKITASESYDGNPIVTYDSKNIQKYKYLKFTEPLVAKNTVTGTIYRTLQAAFDAITASDQTIQLLENIELMDTLTILSGDHKSFTLDLNGKTLDSGYNPAISHEGSGTLTITDKSNDGEGRVTSFAIGGTIYIKAGQLIVNAGTIENTGYSYEENINAIVNDGTGKIAIGGTATICSGSPGATIATTAGIAGTAILEITGGTIENYSLGYAVYNSGLGKIVIPSGSSIIRSYSVAMNQAPDLQDNMMVTASTKYDGSSLEYSYNGNMIHTYKYLKFEPAPEIARIGSKVYCNLQKAVDETDNGQTIDLIGNVNLTWPIVIASETDKSFTINLNGYTIDSKYRSAIRHSGSGTLTITDDSTEGGGVITSIHDNDWGYTIYLDGGSLVVAGGLVENANDLSHCDAIYNNGTGSVSIVSSGVVKSVSGSAIFNASTGKITISGSARVTSGSRAVSDKGTIYLHTYANTEDILLEITGGTIENTCGTIQDTGGYAIYNNAHGKIAITSGSPLIVGSYMAMNQAPDLRLYPNVNITASQYNSGTPRVIYKANNIFYYKYLAFKPATKVAQNTATGAEYFAVQTAIDAAADGDTIALLDDIAFVNPLKIDLKEGKSLTLDLKGKTFEGSMVYTCVSGKLTIDDTVGGGKITAPISSFGSGTIQASGSSPNTAMLEIKGGTVENSDDTGYFSYGGNAIWNKSCTVSVTGGTVTSAGGGAAIKNTNYYPFGTVNVSGGTVINTDKYGSAAIYNEATGTISVSGGTVDGGVGIAIHNDSTGKITISGTAMVTGSRGVNLKAGTSNTIVLEITGGTVESTAAGTGTAINHMDVGIVLISGGVVRATAEGSTAIRNHSAGKISVLGGTVEHTAAGKAIYNTGWGSIEIAGGTVHTENGEAICNEAYGTEILISSGTVSATVGTAIYNTSGFVRIYDGTAIIRGGDRAMNTEPEELDSSLKITASTADANGTDAFEISRDDIISRTIEEYYENRVQAYKYLRFEPAYSVTYSPGANGTGSTVTENKTHDVAFALRGALFTRVGYTQTGWATTDGGTKAYELGGSYTANEVITLYPVWTQNPPDTYTVTYLPGANGMGSVAIDAKTIDVILTLRGATFTRNGYTQTGWATTDGGTKVFELSGSYSDNEAITLYPVWAQNPPDTCSVTYLPGANGTGSTVTENKTHDVAFTLRGALFTREGYTQTGWSITEDDTKTYELGGSYTANEAITLYPVWTQSLPNTYTVMYHPGASGTGTESMDTKTLGVALTLRGATFTRDGFAQTGWATTDGGTKAYELGSCYTDNAAITLYPVWTQNPPTPGGNGDETAPPADTTPPGGTTPPADTTVYNDPSKTSATIWLSGSGLNGNDILVTQAITGGSNYNAMLKLANSGDILHVYDICLKSGKTSTGSAMYLTFNLADQYVGQAFTLVHKKADGTFEYLYATAGMDGKVKFGPVYELSPFMLVKGSLLYVPTEEIINIPKTGDATNSVLFVPLSLAAVCGAGMAVYRKKKA